MLMRASNTEEVVASTSCQYCGVPGLAEHKEADVLLQAAPGFCLYCTRQAAASGCKEVSWEYAAASPWTLGSSGIPWPAEGEDAHEDHSYAQYEGVFLEDVAVPYARWWRVYLGLAPADSAG